MASQEPQVPPPIVIDTPYVPTEEEAAVLAAMLGAISRGAECATTAEASQNDEAWLRYCQGTKTLVDAYLELKTGGKAQTQRRG